MLLTFCIFSALLAGPSRQVYAVQTVPYKMNFQGNLTTPAGAAVADGLYNMKFRLYSGTTGGTALWSSTRDTTNRVSVTGGFFAVQLGDVTPLPPSLFTTQPLYLEVELPSPATATCSTAGCASYTEGPMTPRQPLGSSPYAINSDTLDGLDSSSFGRVDLGNTFTAPNTFKNTTDSTTAFQIQNSAAASLFVADTSNLRIQIGSSTPDSTAVVLVLDTKNTSGDPAGTNGAMYYNSSLGKFRCYENGMWKSCVSGKASVVTIGAPTSYVTWAIPANQNNYLYGAAFPIMSQQDLTNVSQARLEADLGSGTQNIKLWAQYSTDGGSSWSNLCTDSSCYFQGSSGGNQGVSPWFTIPVAAQGDVVLRVQAYNGAGSSQTANVRGVDIQVR